MGDDSYGFLVDHTGRIVTHPQMEVFRADVRDLDRNNATLAELAGLLKEETQGSLRGIDPRTKKPSRFVFVRAPSSMWTFVAVIPGR
jgi:hypothetical protein